jgi:transmembrane sensor
MKNRPQASAESEAVRRAASEWVARADAGLSAADEAELQRWLVANEAHRAAWERMSAAWGVLDQPRRHGTARAAERELTARARRRSQRRLVGATVVTIVALAGIWFQSSRVPLPGPQAAPVVAALTTAPTAASAARTRTLDDGTVVELNAEAEIAVNFTPALRRVQLLRGEAHFEVARNPRRPFLVEASGVEVRAVGTAFAVRLDPAEVEVLVTEGRVTVARPDGAENTADTLARAGGVPVVPAGSRVLVRLRAGVEAPQVASVGRDEIERKLAWRRAWLDFSNTRVADAVMRLNHRNQTQLVIDDPRVAELRVSGLVAANDVDAFVRQLQVLGVQADRRGEHEIVLRREP